MPSWFPELLQKQNYARRVISSEQHPRSQPIICLKIQSSRHHRCYGASPASHRRSCSVTPWVLDVLCAREYQLPKGVVHHQVEDSERALLTVDAGVIAQQLGEGPDPLAGVARANELVADGIPGMYVRCSGAPPSLNVAAGPPSSSPSASPARDSELGQRGTAGCFLR
jgi:hypothetical protein